MLPQILDLSKDECLSRLRTMELETYMRVVSVIRAKGSLCHERRKLLEELAEILNIPKDRQAAEARRACTNEVLTTIAYRLTGKDWCKEWEIEGHRGTPTIERAPPLTANITFADRIALIVASKAADRRRRGKMKKAEKSAIQDVSSTSGALEYVVGDIERRLSDKSQESEKDFGESSSMVLSDNEEVELFRLCEKSGERKLVGTSANEFRVKRESRDASDGIVEEVGGNETSDRSEDGKTECEVQEGGSGELKGVTHGNWKRLRLSDENGEEIGVDSKGENGVDERLSGTETSESEGGEESGREETVDVIGVGKESGREEGAGDEVFREIEESVEGVEELEEMIENQDEEIMGQEGEEFLIGEELVDGETLIIQGGKSTPEIEAMGYVQLPDGVKVYIANSVEEFQESSGAESDFEPRDSSEVENEQNVEIEMLELTNGDVSSRLCGDNDFSEDTSVIETSIIYNDPSISEGSRDESNPADEDLQQISRSSLELCNGASSNEKEHSDDCNNDFVSHQFICGDVKLVEEESTKLSSSNSLPHHQNHQSSSFHMKRPHSPSCDGESTDNYLFPKRFKWSSTNVLKFDVRAINKIGVVEGNMEPFTIEAEDCKILPESTYIISQDGAKENGDASTEESVAGSTDSYQCSESLPPTLQLHRKAIFSSDQPNPSEESQ